MKSLRFLIPLALFLALAAFLAKGLMLDPREVPSPLIGKPAPAFTLSVLGQPEKKFSSADMKGKVWLLNVWSTWCVSCRQEHPLLVDIAKSIGVPIVGLNYKEIRGDSELDGKKLAPEVEVKLADERSAAWLAQRGNPYATVAMDLDGRVGIDYGVYGVPETYLIDKAGIIRYKQIGPVTAEALQKSILPKIQELQK